jgi:drug/metabolite transporter (DMT)-like permease
MMLGFFAFGDFPDLWSLIGIAILVASGIYMAAHQRSINRLRRDEQANLPPSA